MRLDHLRESRDEVSVELTIQLDGKHVSQARFNLSSLTARNSQAKWLREQIIDTVRWRDILEETCVEVLRQHRLGTDVVSLNGQYSQDDMGPPVLPPLLSYKSPTILYGEGGCGKSTFAAGAVLSMETGVEVIPGMSPTPMKVLILDWEDEPWVWAVRLKALAQGAGIPPGTILYQKQRGPLHNNAERLAAYCARESVEVVIVDSMGMAMGAGNEYMNAEQGAIQLFEALKMFDCTSLLVDHVAGRELGSEKSSNRPYGSVYKMNLARSVFELKREKDPSEGRSEVMLINTKANYGPKKKPMGFAMVYEAGTIKFEPTEITAPDMQASRSLSDRIVEAVTVRTLSTAQVSEQLGVTQVAVRKAVQRDSRLTRISDRLIGISGQT